MFWPHIKFENDLVFEIIPKTENTYHVSTLRLATIHLASAQLRSDFDYSPALQKSLSQAKPSFGPAWSTYDGPLAHLVLGLPWNGRGLGD